MSPVMMLAVPIMLLMVPMVSILVMTIICYPVRKAANTIIIGYPIFRKKYNLLNSNLYPQVERGVRGHTYNVVIYAYRSDDSTFIRKHILPGYTFRKRAEKELKKVERIISS